MYIRLIIFITISLNASIFGQMVDTIYLNSKWEKSNKENSTYYRTLLKNTNGIYLCNDYWKTGEIQMTGNLSSLYPETREGLFYWYYKNGKLKQIINYHNNKVVGPIKLFDNEGNFSFEYIGNIDSLDNGQMVNDAIFRFHRYMSKTLKYPEKSRLAEIQGTVKTTFFIDPSGNIYDLRVIESVNKELDQEAIRVIASYKKWPIPIYQGRSIYIQMAFPVIFGLY